jgi:hypothetical protein
MNRLPIGGLILLVSLGAVTTCRAPAAEPKPPAAEGWRTLFDGKALQDWKITNFGGEGEVEVEDGSIVMGFGSSLTGISYKGDVPTTNYEVSLEAQRLDGHDFFCALTFPVDKSHCSLIVGGWAGAVVGLSSIDGRDASQNETTRYMSFRNNQWYRIRVRVERERIQAWIDDERVVDQNIKGRSLDTRVEVELSKPLGIAAWETRAALRNIRIRELQAASR